MSKLKKQVKQVYMAKMKAQSLLLQKKGNVIIPTNLDVSQSNKQA